MNYASFVVLFLGAGSNFEFVVQELCCKVMLYRGIDDVYVDNVTEDTEGSEIGIEKCSNGGMRECVDGSGIAGADDTLVQDSKHIYSNC
jgi:hypothetical protein